MTVEVEPITPLAPRHAGRTVFTQRWAHLTFLHWAVEPDVVAPLLLPGLRPDTLDGLTYVALVPFVMQDVGAFGAPRMPYVGDFCETNVRLYSVDGSGRRGVVFRSLDASRLAPVLVARWGPGLPYVWSRMRFSARPTAAGGAAQAPTDGGVRLTREPYPAGTVLEYTSRRRLLAPAAAPAPAGGTGPGTRSGARSDAMAAATAHPRSTVRVRVGDAVEAGPLEHFLSARWGLHLLDRGGRLRYWPNEHPQWPLHAAQALEVDDQVLASAGFPGLAGRPPDSVLYSAGVDVRFGPPTR